MCVHAILLVYAAVLEFLVYNEHLEHHFLALKFFILSLVSEQGALVGSYKGTCRFYGTSGILKDHFCLFQFFHACNSWVVVPWVPCGFLCACSHVFIVFFVCGLCMHLSMREIINL